MYARFVVPGLAAAAWLFSSPAVAQGTFNFSVRNDSGATLSCMVSRHGRSRFDRIVLRPGGAWSESARTDDVRRIYCDPPARPARFRIEANREYHFVPHRSSMQVILVPL